MSVDPRWEPGAGNPLAGFCPGGGPKGPSLPGQIEAVAREEAALQVTLDVATAEVGKRSLAERTALAEVMAIDAEDPKAWETADAKARRLTQARHQAEQNQAEAVERLKAVQRVRLEKIIVCAQDPLAARMTLVPRFEAIQDELMKLTAEMGVIINEQEQLAAAGRSLCASLGVQRNVPSIDRFAHVHPIHGHLNSRMQGTGRLGLPGPLPLMRVEG